MLTSFDKEALSDLAQAVVTGARPERVAELLGGIRPAKVTDHLVVLRQLVELVADQADEIAPVEGTNGERTNTIRLVASR